MKCYFRYTVLVTVDEVLFLVTCVCNVTVRQENMVAVVIMRLLQQSHNETVIMTLNFTDSSAVQWGTVRGLL